MRIGEVDAPLHVTNGESVARTLRETALPGGVLAWNDVLHVGPLAFDVARSRRVRADFLASRGWGDETATRREQERRDGLLERVAAVKSEIVLWFEHDLADQLQLLQVLARLSDDACVELVQTDVYLGSISAAELEQLYPHRSRLEPATLAVARDAWRDVCHGDVAAVLARDTRALPHLDAALRRLLEERAEPLSRTKRQLLRAVADGARTPREAFFVSQAMEDAVFLGDAWAFADLHDLARRGLVTPLPEPPPRGDDHRFAAARVEITPAGLSILSA